MRKRIDKPTLGSMEPKKRSYELKPTCTREKATLTNNTALRVEVLPARPQGLSE